MTNPEKNVSNISIPEQEAPNILVIDDEEIMRNLLKDLLTDLDYEVTSVETGEEGLATFKSQNYQVVITDLRMPGLDGIKVLEEVKRHDPDAVVIVITGFGALESAQNALRLGAFDYITKPFELNDIVFIVKRAIQTRNLMKANKSLLSFLENQNVMLDKKVSARTQELEVLYTVGKRITSLQEGEILQRVVCSLAEKMEVRKSSILMYDHSKNVLQLKAFYGISEQEAKGLEVSLGRMIHLKNCILLQS